MFSHIGLVVFGQVLVSFSEGKDVPLFSHSFRASEKLRSELSSVSLKAGPVIETIQKSIKNTISKDRIRR